MGPTTPNATEWNYPILPNKSDQVGVWNAVTVHHKSDSDNNIQPLPILHLHGNCGSCNCERGTSHWDCDCYNSSGMWVVLDLYTKKHMKNAWECLITANSDSRIKYLRVKHGYIHALWLYNSLKPFALPVYMVLPSALIDCHIKPKTGHKFVLL